MAIFDPDRELVAVTVIGQQGCTGDLLGRKKIFSPAGEAGDLVFPWLEEGAAGLAREVIKIGAFMEAEFADPSISGCLVRVMADPFLPAPGLVILGGGHIALPLVKMGKLLGYRVTVVDDRPEFASAGRFPEADRVVCCSFDTIDETVSLGASSSVVIVTRGHRHDLDCLRKVIKYPLAYLGMIGSRRKVNAIRQQLAGEGVGEERLNSVHMPIGLDIGAQTPEEIAVSIAAEMVMARRGGGARSMNAAARGACPAAGCFEIQSEVNRDILTQMLRYTGNPPAALATVAGTRGSTPRKAGAKMLVYRDGRILGTTGGGLGEAEVRSEALKVIDEGTPRMYRISLDADTAASEGMICGGAMEVFIEPAEVFAGLLAGGGGDGSR